MTYKQEDGFTLIELAIVILISGLIIGSAASMIKPYLESAQINSSREKMNKISDSLALFAQTNGRLPCPARSNPPPGNEPFGAPVGSGTTGTNILAACGGETIPGDYIGIVPFRALGLSEDNVRDGYGNFLTYAVSPVLAGLTTGTVNEVHEACRVQNRWVDMTGTPANINPVKARVCCTRFVTNTDITVLDGRGSPTQVFTGTHSANAAFYNNPNTAFVGTAPNTENRFIAFTLISHGKNGDGAFIRNGGTNGITAVVGAQEGENNNNDLIFVDRPISRTGNANYFDDLVVWRTNDQLINAFGNDSCGRP